MGKLRIINDALIEDLLGRHLQSRFSGTFTVNGRDCLEGLVLYWDSIHQYRILGRRFLMTFVASPSGRLSDPIRF